MEKDLYSFSIKILVAAANLDLYLHQTS